MRKTTLAAACSLALMSAPALADGTRDKDAHAQDKAAHQMHETKDKHSEQVTETTVEVDQEAEGEMAYEDGEQPDPMDISDAQMPENLDEELADAQQQMDEAIATLQQMRSDPELSQTLDEAKGVFMVPEYAAAAMIAGGSGGEGVLLPRQDGDWGNPAFYDVGSVSFGAQVGVEAGSIALLLMSDEALDSFKQGNNFSLNADAGYSIVDWSDRAEASVGRGDVIAWSDTEGLFAQAALAVSSVNYDEDETFAYYNQPVTPSTVLDGLVDNPHPLDLSSAAAVQVTDATSSSFEGEDPELTAETGQTSSWPEEQGDELAAETEDAVAWTEEQGDELAAETDEQTDELATETEEAVAWTEEQGDELAAETDQQTDELAAETEQAVAWNEEQGDELAAETDQQTDELAADTREEMDITGEEMPDDLDEELADAQEQVDEAIATLQEMRSDEALSDAMNEAKAVFVVPGYAAAALIVGGSGGEGVLMPRQNGEWGNPAFYDVGSVSFGAQLGVEAGAIALLLMTDEAVESFKRDNNFSLNADAGFTIIDWSARAEASVGRGDVIAWSDTEGLFAQAAIAVADINFDEEETFAYYNQPVTASAVLDGQVENPQAVELRDALAQQ